MMNHKIYFLVAALLALVILAAGWFAFADPLGIFSQPITVQQVQTVPASKDDLITVSSPLPGATITSPLIITGRARGTWYFEASFPVILKDAAGNILAQTPAQAQGDWMTADYVPFAATLQFTAPAGGQGTLILKKDNPSGQPENDDELSIPVTF
jgi:hypothetical protein